MKRLTLKDKALRVIEVLVSDDLSETLTYSAAMKRPITLTEEDKKILVGKLSTIYKITHSVNENHSCFGVHGDWRRAITRMYRRCKGNNLIKELEVK